MGKEADLKTNEQSVRCDHRMATKYDYGTAYCNPDKTAKVNGVTVHGCGMSRGVDNLWRGHRV